MRWFDSGGVGTADSTKRTAESPITTCQSPDKLQSPNGLAIGDSVIGDCLVIGIWSLVIAVARNTAIDGALAITHRLRYSTHAMIPPPVCPPIRRGMIDKMTVT